MDAINKVAAPLERATQVQDDRLAALYVYKAYDELTDKDKDTKKDLEGIKDPAHNFTIEVSLGTQKSESQAQSSSTLAQGSNITAQGDVNIHATKEDINIHGSNVSGENVNLKAQENINITASDNTNTSDETSKSSKGSIGVSISASGISGINAGYNQAKGEIKENSTVYNQSSVTARDTLTLESGQDTNIIGSKVSGDTVKADVGENLNIESLQAQETYDEKNSSSGMGISVDLTQKGKTSIQGSASKGKIESDYQSVTEQAGIYAGEGGFDINVGKNTDLKGAVISSEATPDKNKISTDTLTFSDIENKAEYSASSSGVSVDFKDGKLTGGSTPTIPVNGDSNSTTKSAISPGRIEVRSGNADISKLSRNTDQALNALGKIFDKETVKEKQELVNLFSQEANKAIGDLAEHMRDKASTPEEKAKWGEGGEYKALLHAVAAGITSSLSGNGFASGAAADGLSQLAQKELAKITDPNLRLIASSIVGAAAAKAVGGNAQVGAGVAYNGVKYNDYVHKPTSEGSIIYDPDKGFYKIHYDENGKEDDEYMGSDWYPEPGQVYWRQDKEENYGTMGWEYVSSGGNPNVKDPYVGSWQSNTVYAGAGAAQVEVTIRIALDEDGNPIIKNGQPIIYPEDKVKYNDAAKLSEYYATSIETKGVMLADGLTSSGTAVKGSSKAIFKAGKTTIEDIAANPKALSGKSAEEVAQMLREAGYDVTVQASKKSTSGAQIIKINNPGEGRNITQVQVSPGGGRHGANPYVKISTSDQGIIKIVDGVEDIYKTDGVETAKIIFTGGK
jgi:hypothetical protein